MLASEGETATKAEVFSWRKVVRGERRIFYCVGGSGVRPVIAYDGGSWAKGLRGEGVEKAGKELGAVAGSDKGHDGWGVLHKSMMEVFRLGGSLIEEKMELGRVRE